MLFPATTLPADGHSGVALVQSFRVLELQYQSLTGASAQASMNLIAFDYVAARAVPQADRISAAVLEVVRLDQVVRGIVRQVDRMQGAATSDVPDVHEAIAHDARPVCIYQAHRRGRWLATR